MKNRWRALLMTLALIVVAAGVLGSSTADAKGKKTGIVSVNVLNSKVVRVKLANSGKVSKKKVKISVREDKKGRYNKSVSVGSVVKVNKKTYDIILKEDSDEDVSVNYFSTGDIVRVKIGNSSKEVVYYSENKPGIVYVSGVTGQQVSQSVYFDGYTKGYDKFKISKLPKGIKAKKAGKSVVLTGKPKAVSNGKKVTITATDEYGRKVKRTVLFYIGSASKVITYAAKENNTVLSGDQSSETFTLHTVGGSGSYTYKMTNKVGNVSLSGNEVVVSDKVAAGKRTVKYSVTDSKNHKASSSLKLVVKKAVKVTGVFKTQDKKNMDRGSLSFIIRDTKNDYHNSYMNVEWKQAKSGYSYTAYVAPNAVYTVSASSNEARKYTYNFKVAKKAKKLNISLPLYKITFKASDKSDISSVSWYSGNDYIGYGTVMYLKKGAHKITGTSGIKKYSASFNVRKSATVTLKVSSGTSGSITENTAKTISAGTTAKYYTFKPSKTGAYCFTTSATSGYMYVALYTSASMSDYLFSTSSSSSNECTRAVQVNEGQTYYLRVRADDDYSSSASTTVKFEEISSLTADSTVSVSLGANSKKYYAFTPAVSGYYMLQANNISGMAMIGFCDSYFDTDVSKWNYDNENSMSLNSGDYLNAGTTYYVVVGSDEDSISMNVSISHNADYDA